MKSDKVPRDDFNEGFRVGYQLIRGTNSAIPGIPDQPGTAGNTPPFLNGIKEASGCNRDDWQKKSHSFSGLKQPRKSGYSRLGPKAGIRAAGGALTS